MLSLSNCCTTAVLTSIPANQEFKGEKELFDKLRFNVVHIKAYSKVKIQSQTLKINFTQTTTQAGSGIIVQNLDNFAFIVTAGHVCEVIRKQALFKFDQTKDTFSETRTLIITNPIGFNAQGLILVTNETQDLCFLVAKMASSRTIELEPHPQQIGERIYFLCYPQGLWFSDYSPILDGRYVGRIELPFNQTMANAYTVPVAKGCSGGPVFNLKGNLVSIIHSHASEFANLGIGASSDQILKGLLVAKEVFKKNKETLESIL